MKQLSITIFIIILLGFFIYAASIISQNNTCTGVRSFLCEKKNAEILAIQKEAIKAEIQKEQELLLTEKINTSLNESSDEYKALRKMGDSFIHLCKPLIIEQTGSYLLDYTSCNLHVISTKDGKNIQDVQVNGKTLPKDAIQEELGKLYFTF